MSLGFKTLAAVNVAGWLVAVPLLLAALLTPIVGFSGWEDRLLPGGGDETVRLAEAPSAAVRLGGTPGRVAARGSAPVGGSRAHARPASPVRAAKPARESKAVEPANATQQAAPPSAANRKATKAVNAPTPAKPINAPKAAEPVEAPSAAKPVKAPEPAKPIKALKVPKPVKAPKPANPANAPQPAKHVNAPDSVAEPAPAGPPTGAPHTPKNRK